MPLSEQELRRIETLERNVNQVKDDIQDVKDVLDKFALRNTLDQIESDLKNLITSLEERVDTTEEKVNTVILPDEAMVYLTQSQLGQLKDKIAHMSNLVSQLESVRDQVMMKLQLLREAGF